MQQTDVFLQLQVTVQLLPLSGDGFFQGDVDLFDVAHKVLDVLGFLRFSCPVPQ